MDSSVFMQLLTGAVGGAIVSSLVGPYVLQGKERRQARADVLNAFVEVEASRWANNESTFLAFRQKVWILKASSLVAGVPSVVVDTYTQLAAAARDISQNDFDEDPSDEYSGGIPSDVAELVRDAAEALILCTRYPLKGWFLRRKLLTDIRDKTLTLQKRYAAQKRHINLDIGDF